MERSGKDLVDEKDLLRKDLVFMVLDQTGHLIFKDLVRTNCLINQLVALKFILFTPFR